MPHSTGCIRSHAELINDLAKSSSTLKPFIHTGSHGLGDWEKICEKASSESDCAMSLPNKKKKRWGGRFEFPCPFPQAVRHNGLRSNCNRGSQIAETDWPAACVTEQRLEAVLGLASSPRVCPVMTT